MVRLIVRLIVSVGLVSFLVYFTDSTRLIKNIQQVDPYLFLAASLLIFSLAVLQAKRWQYVLKSMNQGLSFAHAIRIVIMSLFFNQTLPSSIGGDAIRVWEVVRLGMPTGIAVKSVLADRMFALTSLIFLTLVGLPFLLTLLTKTEAVIGLVLLVVSLIAAIIFVIFFSRLPFLPKTGWLWSSLVSLSESSFLAFSNIRVAIPAFLLATAMQIGIVTAFFIITIGSSLELDFLALLFLLPIVLIVQVAPVSIAGWGTREGAMILVLSLIGVDFNQALGVSVLLGLSFLLSGIPGGFVWLLGVRHARKEEMR